MGKRKSTGSVRSDASQSKPRRAGRTRTIADSGIALAALPSTIPLHVAEPFFSIAYQQWRIETTQYDGPRFEQKQQHSLFYDDPNVAWDVYERVKDCRTWDAYWEMVATLRAIGKAQ